MSENTLAVKDDVPIATQKTALEPTREEIAFLDPT